MIQSPRLQTLFLAAAFAAPAAAWAAAPPQKSAPQHRTARSAPVWGDRIAELSQYRLSDVTSAWLTNGVRVHHRRIEQPPGQVQITIAILGSEMLESTATRGLSALAAAALDDWTHTAPRSIAQGAGVQDIHVDATAGVDSIQLRVWGSAADLDGALTVAAELLTAPHIDDATLGLARADALREIAKRAADPRAAVSQSVLEAMFPADDPRARPLTREQVERHTAQNVSDWLAHHLAKATYGEAAGREPMPIEAAIVGDISLEDAFRLADKHLGALPARPRPTPLAHTLHAQARPPALPLTAVLRKGQSPDRAVVMVGCIGPDIDQTADLRTLRVAARIVGDRASRRLAPPTSPAGEPHKSVDARRDSAGASVVMSAYPSMGAFLASADVPLAGAEAARAVLEQEIAALAANPPATEEYAPINEAMARMVQANDRDARYWSTLLARVQSLNIDPDEAVEGPAFYRALTGDAVSATLRKYWRAEKRLTITVEPQ